MSKLDARRVAERLVPAIAFNDHADERLTYQQGPAARASAPHRGDANRGWRAA
jgi:hypothetical protein